MLVDLHFHSTRSDGMDSPATVAGLAKTSGASVVSLTDHDTSRGWHEFLAYLNNPNVHAIRGAEISCYEDDETIHVLAYDTGGNWDVLDDFFGDAQARRRDRLLAIGERLEKMNLPIDVQKLIAAADGRSVGRPDIAREMVKRGYVSSFKDAFTRYLHDGGPGDVPSHRISMTDALALGRAAGAKMSLAHPHLHGNRAEGFLRKYRDDGLDGIEAGYGRYTPSERIQYYEIAEQLNLVCTAGSDRHVNGDGKLGVELERDRALRLWEWLQIEKEPPKS